MLSVELLVHHMLSVVLELELRMMSLVRNTMSLVLMVPSTTSLVPSMTSLVRRKIGLVLSMIGLVLSKIGLGLSMIGLVLSMSCLLMELHSWMMGQLVGHSYRLVLERTIVERMKLLEWLERCVPIGWQQHGQLVQMAHHSWTMEHHRHCLVELLIVILHATKFDALDRAIVGQH